ncbi:MAG: hypothetical protein J1D77_02270 [Muribaculaceae bacterium]|nr:hypothetical protein [Muribaculaceae bacterium]
MNKKILYTGLTALVLTFLSGCIDREESPEMPERDLVALEGVSAMFADEDGLSPEEGQEGEGDIEIEIEDPANHKDLNEVALLLDDMFHNEPGGRVDTLFFSQLVSGKLVPFQGVSPENFPENMNQDMRERFAEGYPNLYRYYYQNRYSAVWEDEPGGYNFFPTDTLKKMNWDHIKFWGKNNTGYVLYALYYPYNNILPFDETGNVDFKVETDQTTKEALRKSNFIGAYHSSAKSGQRLKFKLFHLASYLKVTLYVPVYNPNDSIMEGNKKVPFRSGFPADALIKGVVRNVYNRYSVNWYGGRSSDSAPVTSVVTTTPRTDVTMYMPTAEDYPETNGLPPKVTVRVSDYIRDAEAQELPEYDECWKITLSALIPSGQDYPIGDNEFPQGQIWTDLNFLRFYFRQNIGDVPKVYVFTGNSSSGLIGSGKLSIGQGELQHLSLYIPRYGAKAVLLNANVTDWEQWYNSNMGLRKDDPLESPQPEPED